MERMEHTYHYNMQLTLEQHFENIAENYPAIQEIYSLWVLIKKRIEDELIPSRSVFVSYSLHDGSHSRTVIQAIERFLGEDRIRKLSVTDTFMLLACAYAHDYGMSLTFNKIYDILGSEEFENFLRETNNNLSKLEEDDIVAVQNLLHYINEGKPHIPLKEMYFSIMMVIQLYLRPAHWKGVAEIRKEFAGLFSGHIKKRFIYGSEGIVEVSMCHGLSMENVLKLSQTADGMVGDDYHPRFVAAMLRLGDLLDLDNDRFPAWFAREIAQDRNVIPKLSVMHYRKHEAVSHFLITPSVIEVTVHCYSRFVGGAGEMNNQMIEILKERAQKESNQVAALVSEWKELLMEERKELVMHWAEIAQSNFGGPPANIKFQIYVDNIEYMAESKTFQMRMSQERVMDLLEGTSIYRDKYVGIREMIQNAIDASLLQLWSDLLHNRYSSYGLSKNKVRSKFDLFDLLDENKRSIFDNYDITVEVIEDKLREQVFIVVKDKGIGITVDEVECIAEIGSSKKNNSRLSKLIDSMPPWLKPSGVFGIGLQSVFQLTDCIEFYTRQHNEPERLISLYSYGKNKGKIEVQELPESAGEVFYDNSVPGTNVKIAVDKGKFPESRKSNFKYYDPEFDTGEVLDMIYAEVTRACKDKIRESSCDYFNVSLESKKIEKNGDVICDGKSPVRGTRKSYFRSKKEDVVYFGESLQPFLKMSEDGYSFSNDKAFFWDKKAYRCYFLTIRPCKIIENYENSGKNRLFLPEKVPNLYNFCYKFNMISNAESIYAHRNRYKQLHAGFLKLNVLILDDRPMDYMNIDRDRLRDEAIDEEELLAVRGEILKNWCKYFCGDTARGSNNSSTVKNRKIYFAAKPGMLVSLILLFYQNVSSELLQQFIKPYEEIVNKWNPYLEDEEILVSQLWNQNNLFRVGQQLPYSFKDEDISIENQSAIEIKQKNISKLPHRLMHIERIEQSGNMLWYYLSLGVSKGKEAAIQMSDEVRLHDYIYALDLYMDSDHNINFQSLIRKVFKPDKRYERLFVPCYPQTFDKGKNMETDMDYCINGYILSPFDNDATSILKRCIKDGIAGKEELISVVMNSTQLDKCVSYIMKKTNKELPADREAIRRQYEDFVANFYTILMNNRDFVNNKFKI